MGFYLGYMTPKPGGLYDVVIAGKEASQEVLTEFEELTAVVTDLQPLTIALSSVEGDFEELVELPVIHARKLDDLGEGDIPPMGFALDLLADAARAFSGFLASATALLCQSGKYVSRVHGKDSALAQRWHERRRGLHADAIGYRICYALRNFSQHYALPLSGLDVQGERTLEDRMAHRTDMYLTRTGLLNSGWDWAKTRRDIEAQEEVFQVLPLVEEYVQCLRALIDELASYRADDLFHCRSYVEAVRRVLKAPPAARIWLFERAGPEIDPEGKGMIVPEEQLLWTVKRLFGHRLRGLGIEPSGSA